MTWNGHGIWCGFGPNCRRFVTKWNGISVRIHDTFFTEAEKYGERHTGHSLCSWPMLFSCHMYFLQETSNFLSFRVTTFSVFTIFKIWLQIRIYYKILIWKPASYDFWRKNFKVFKFLRHKIFSFQNFQNLTSFLESA